MTEPKVGARLKDSADRDRCSGELVVGPGKSATLDGMGLTDLRRQSNHCEARREANTDPPFFGPSQAWRPPPASKCHQVTKERILVLITRRVSDALALEEVRSRCDASRFPTSPESRAPSNHSLHFGKPVGPENSQPMIGQSKPMFPLEPRAQPAVFKHMS